MSDFNDILKNKLDNFRETPADEVFQQIRKNYPKKSFKDIIRNNKYYFIAAVSTLVVIGLVLISQSIKTDQPISKISEKTNKSENEHTINNTTTINENLNTTNQNNNHIPDRILNVVSDNTDVKQFIFADIFNSEDTTICGLAYETTISGSTDHIILPSGMKMVNVNDKLVFTGRSAGNYKILYSEFAGSNVIRDSLSLTFVNSQKADVKLSKETLCPGEDLTITIKNADGKINWLTNNIKVSEVASGMFIIDGLKSGNNKIAFELSDNNCNHVYEKSVNVAKQPDYSYTTTPNICSGANATLSIAIKNSDADLFVLNNEILSKNGHFTNLNSGIYTLKVNFENGCQLFDTLFIRDSLNISPYFISERDLVNKNKYYFRNLSNVDDKGYERNNNIEFVWTVNGSELFRTDNPVYEFTTEGNNVVELIAILNETCQSKYSETILISGTNFKIPNIFTPNGDGIGDEYKVIYEGELASYNINIINRMGEIVFDSQDINLSWDGKINGNDDAGEGLYYYIIRGEDKFGNNIEQKGSLQLVRH